MGRRNDPRLSAAGGFMRSIRRIKLADILNNLIVRRQITIFRGFGSRPEALGRADQVLTISMPEMLADLGGVTAAIRSATIELDG